MTDLSSHTGKQKQRVAIIGAGVVGLGIAWRLAARGVAVEVFDRGRAGGGASHAAAGMLAACCEAEPGEETLVALGRESQARWPAFAAELQEATGIDVELRTEGTLMVALTADDQARLQHHLVFQHKLGLPLEWLVMRSLSVKDSIQNLDDDLLSGEASVTPSAGDKAADGLLRHMRRIPDALSLSVADRRRRGIAMEGYWGRQSTNTRDRATAMMPRMLYDRLGELGIDFGIVYPTLGLGAFQGSNRVQGAGLGSDLRRCCVRAYNTMASDMFRDYANRMTPAAIIPTVTPREGIEEAEYAVLNATLARMDADAAT